MIVSSLKLKDFRNHSYLFYDFKSGINVFTGNNAVGKTNVMEAIHYLSLARSFRTEHDDELIKKTKEKAEIEAKITQGEINRKIQITIFKEGKRVNINNKIVAKTSELNNVLNVTLFEPKDVMLFKGPPKNRRNFIDISLSKKTPLYLEYYSRYDKVLRERNEILKSNDIDYVLLDATTEMLIKLSEPLVNYRQMYVKDINNILNKVTRALTGTCDKFEIIYHPFINGDIDFASNAKEAFNRSKDTDIKHKTTSIGVHREDFEMTLDGRNIGEYGSQGENRIAALALKLSPYFLIEDKEKRPIIILDDVMSELDGNHKKRLIEFLKKFEQVFITATKLKIDGASQYEIKEK